MKCDPVREYLDANHHLAKATKELARVLQTIERVQRYIFNIAANTPTGDESLSFGSLEWPSAQNIEFALAQYHSMRSSVEAAWQEIDQNDRAVLFPPPRRAETTPRCMSVEQVTE